MPRAKIATKQAKYTLEQLHAELGGKILDNKKEAKRLAQAMVHVEAVLRMLEPGYNVRSIAVRRRKPNPWFRRGTVFRAALDALRAAGKPLASREIVVRMLAAKGVTDAKPKAVRDLAGAVLASLRNHKGSSVIAVGEGMPARWKIVQKADSHDQTS
jgi:hypothetical protein